MAVERFRSIEEMGAAPIVVAKGDGFERFARHCARYWAIAPRAYPRGVFRFRTLAESGGPIDASGSLPDGTRFTGAAGLREALLARRAQFVTTLTEKLLTYALGRGVEYYDQPAVRTIVRDAASRDYRFATLVAGVVRSTPFQMRRTRS